MKISKETLGIFFTLVAIIFFAEFGIMIGLDYVFEIPNPFNGLIDATVLSILSSFGIFPLLKRYRQRAHNAKLAIDITDDGYWIFDKNGRFIEVNEGYCRLLGYYSPKEVLKMHVCDLEVGESPEGVEKRTQNIMQQGYGRFETRHRHKDGHLIDLEVSVTYVNGSYFVAFLRDITERRRAEEELLIASKVFEAQEAMLVTDPGQRIIRVNEAFTRITGYTPQEVIGKTPRIFKSGRHSQDFYQEMWSKIEREGRWQGEIWDKRKSGAVYPKWLTISSVRNKAGAVTHYVGSFTDISDYKEAQEKILSLAFYDQLTGLPNRRLLLERLERAMAVSARHQRFGAILYLDLDHFKTINDTQGHDCGDLLLQETARRIQAIVRQEDTVARIGGDEFVVLLEEINTDKEQAAAQAKVVGDKLLEVLARPYQIKDKEYPGSVSMGVALFRDSPEGLLELLRRADMAMYDAKKAGRNALRFFDPVMQETLERRTQLALDLRHALEQGEFQLYFQKRIASDGGMKGAEVLLRWSHPQRGLLAPEDFIPLAEETGLIVPIGRWVLEESCRRLKAWEGNEKTKNLMLSVNISTREFKQTDFVDNVRRIVAQTGINPSLLMFEITESLMMENLEDFIGKMEILKEMGIFFSLDDFGTGYSSLAYLKRLPINELKIDKSFVRDLGMDKNDEAIVQTIIQMGKTLGLEVVAEGAENRTQCEMLEQYGCHNYQGYLFGRPVKLEEFERELAGEGRGSREG